MGEEIQHSPKRRRVGQAAAQGIGGQAGKREETFRTRAVRQYPAECLQRD